jgi:hypothetical protein
VKRIAKGAPGVMSSLSPAGGQHLAPIREGIAITRSFGRSVTAWPEMREACAW